MSNSTEINQQYFNKIAADYDKRFAKSFAAVNAELQANVDFIGIKKGGRLLDYACGTGFVSISLSEFIGEAVGVDITENMIGAYNAKITNANLPQDKFKAHIGNLLSTPTSPALDDALFHGFDAAGVGMGFHHFEDTTLAATRLAERLSIGGSLFVLDFLPHEAEPHHIHGRGVHHLGFDEGRIRDMFEAASAGGDFAFKVFESDVVLENSPEPGMNMHRRLFLARGTKTA